MYIVGEPKSMKRHFCSIIPTSIATTDRLTLTKLKRFGVQVAGVLNRSAVGQSLMQAHTCAQQLTQY